MEKKVIDCPVREAINTFCSCPKTECENHGLCCECIVNHKNRVDAPVVNRFPHCLRDLINEAMGKSMASKSMKEIIAITRPGEYPMD